MDAKTLVERMSADEVTAWATLLQLVGGDGLRGKLEDAIGRSHIVKLILGIHEPATDSSELPHGVQLRLAALVREELVDMLMDVGTVDVIPATVYDKFFPKGSYVSEGYKEQVAKHCIGVCDMYREKLIQLLRKGE